MTYANHLDAVTLDELNIRAALLTRTDRKYVVPTGALRSLLDGLADAPRVLEIGGQRDFRYVSTYFDTNLLDSYRGAAHGHRRRFKVRTRHYADTGGAWLEVKTRGGREVTIKTRTAYADDSLHTLTPAGQEFVADQLAAGGLQRVDVATLTPALDTAYRRTTLLMADGLSRVTIDAGLTWYGPAGLAWVGEVAVIETKTARGIAGGLDRVLWRRGHRPVQISKYGTGMHLLHPELPGHKWRRVISRDLDATVHARRAA